MSMHKPPEDFEYKEIDLQIPFAPRAAIETLAGRGFDVVEALVEAIEIAVRDGRLEDAGRGTERLRYLAHLTELWTEESIQDMRHDGVEIPKFMEQKDFFAYYNLPRDEHGVVQLD